MKHSGGISVLISNPVFKGIDATVKISDYSVWIKVCKDFLNTNQDLYVGVIYLPPENSSFSRRQDADVITSLEEDISLFSKAGEVLLLGDFNGRTHTEHDFIVNDSSKFLASNMPYVADTYVQK